MPKVYIRPSARPESYPNGGDQAYWMHKIAAALQKALAGLGVDCVLGVQGEQPPGDCGLLLSLSSHAAPAELEARLKGAGVYCYAYSPAGRQAAEGFAACLRKLYPQPELVELVPTPARQELSDAKAPALLVQLGYHDNPQDEAWLVNNVEEIAQGLARAAGDFLGVESGVDGLARTD